MSLPRFMGERDKKPRPEKDGQQTKVGRQAYTIVRCLGPMASQEEDAPVMISKPPPEWHSEAREWFMAGIPVLAVTLLLIIAILTTRLWELDNPLRLVPWAFGLVAAIIGVMGSVFCIQGSIRRENPALLLRKVRGDQAAKHIIVALKERFQVQERELKVWPSLGYWFGITCLTISQGSKEIGQDIEEEKADPEDEKSRKDEGDGKEEDGPETVKNDETEPSTLAVDMEIKEVWIHRSQAHASLSVLYGTQVALSASGIKGEEGFDGESKARMSRLTHEVQEHLEPVALELEMEGRLIIR